MFFFDPLYIHHQPAGAGVGVVGADEGQVRVQQVFARAGRARDLAGAQVARRILDANGLGARER